MNRFFNLLSMACIMSACSHVPPNTAAAAASGAMVPVAGADSHAHGCKASAGYTWSVVRSECIRIFESGLVFQPYPAPTQGAVLAAFVVLAPAQGDAVTAAEVFVPGRTSPVALSLVHTPEGDIRPKLLENPAEAVRLFRHKDEHVLEVGDQIYRRVSTPDDRLHKLR